MIEDKFILGNMIREKAQTTPDQPLFIWERQTYTYALINEMTNRVATGLSSLGLKKGDEICTFMYSSPEYIYLWIAFSKLGLVEIPINYSFKGQLLLQLINFTEAKYLIVDEKLLDALNEVCPQLKKIKTIIVKGEIKCVCNNVNYLSFNDLLRSRPDEPVTEINYYELATIMFTSGTTGPSKGALQSHYQQTFFASIWKNIIGCQETDVLYNYFPYYHIASRFLTYTCIMTGAKFLLRERFSISQFWEDVRKHNVTILFAIGGLCHMIYSLPHHPEDKNNPIHTVYAVPVPAELYESFEERFNVKFCEAYGTTETNLVLHTTIGEKTPIGSCGKPDKDFEVKIVDEYDQELPPGIIGEIVVRPKKPNAVFFGYYKRPQESLDMMRNLWIHMEDVGYRDEAGFFYFVDRKKDAIRRRGENISSYEIEKIVNLHPAVAETAAIGVPSEVGEEDVKICLRLRESQKINEIELIKFCYNNMAYFMVPRYIEFLEEFPRTPTGKIEKYKLKQMGEKGLTDNTWDREKLGIKISHKGIRGV
jgi:crotonobetaine/carnitine-CoA ligase